MQGPGARGPLGSTAQLPLVVLHEYITGVGAGAGVGAILQVAMQTPGAREPLGSTAQWPLVVLHENITGVGAGVGTGVGGTGAGAGVGIGVGGTGVGAGVGTGVGAGVGGLHSLLQSLSACEPALFGVHFPTEESQL